MKLKIKKTRFQIGYYYLIYEWFWFHWVRRSGLYDTLEEAEMMVVRLLKDEKERRKTEKENPVYYRLEGNEILRKKSDGIERVFMVIMGDPPLKLKKTEK